MTTPPPEESQVLSTPDKDRIQDGSDSDENEDDQVYRLHVNPAGNPRKISDKKRRDLAIFQTWMDENQREISQTSSQGSRNIEDSSLLSIINDASTKKIIASPREYQIELFERAKEKNIIVVLDTGSGKTLIAVLLMRHIIEQEQPRGDPGRPKRAAFFVVDKNALCHQQFAVLKNNLPFTVSKLHGNAPGLRSTREFWEEQIRENMAIVCTAQLLLDALRNGFLTISQINLLIFDEVHHAKKNHPYARIVKNYYMQQPDKALRPRILGMTASPVDSQASDMRAAAADLEALLCSEIATISDEALLQSFNNRQLIESVERYSRPAEPEDTKTALWDAIYEQVGYNSEFRAPLAFTREASSALGPWCADHYWSLYITDAEVAKLAGRTEQQMLSDRTALAQSEEAVSAIYNVKQVLSNHEFTSVSKNLDQISSKVHVLWEVLENAFHVQGTQRAIVFVEKRPTAVLLTEVLKHPELCIRGVSPAYMIGTQSFGSGWPTMTFREQVFALERFKNGSVNCLFATTVAEEGIDIPECDLVIRFDLYNSVIQYIQSRGRARQSRSRYISMIEENNMSDLRKLKQASRDSNTLRQFCAALPADRKVQDEIVDTIALIQAEQVGQKYHETKAGARLSFENSIEVLEKFVSSLSTGTRRFHTEYVVIPMGKKFVADVILPESCPINRVAGHPQRNKQLSRYSAAFEACIKLLEKKYLDDHLQSAFTKKLPAMRNARLAISPNKKAEYTMLMKPKIWSQLGTDEQPRLFPTLLALKHAQSLGRDSQPLILLTREVFPSLPDIQLFFGNGHSSSAAVLPSHNPLELNKSELEMLKHFTLRVFSDLFSKDYDAEIVEMPYFLAPVTSTHAQVLAKGEGQIDWSCLEKVLVEPHLDPRGKSEEFFEDKLAIDPLDGSRKLILHGINKNLKPTDPTPEYAPLPRSRGYRGVAPIIKEYSNSLNLRARTGVVWDDDQPVVDAEILSLRRDFLDQFFVDSINDRCCVILEPLKISAVPMGFIAMANLLPALLFQIDQFLIALEVCTLFKLDIRPDLALEAVTKGGNEGDPEEDDRNNYERLEFLGDTFLKMATTISLFTLLPESTEFDYHVERMLLVCNNNLFNHAVDRKLQEYIRSKSFDRRTWYPNLKLKKGKAPKFELRHNLADKSIADMCEALIGAAYLSGENMDLAVQAVTVMVKSKNHKVKAFDQYYQAYKVPDWQNPERATAAHESTAQTVGKKVGYTFRAPSLARSAFKHPSWTWDTVPHYQQLEFLGDALLDMSFVDYLFRNFPSADPQWLTEHKMAMASNQFLGFLCVKLELHPHLMSTTAALGGQVRQYVAYLEQAEEAAKHHAETTGAPMRVDYWLEVPPPPKALPDIVEALVGAMFVDARYDYSVVQRFFTEHVLPYFANMATYDTFANSHPVTGLSQKLGAEFGCTDWRLCASSVPCGIEEGAKAVTDSDALCALVIHENVVEHATSKMGRHAKVSVASRALERFRGMDRGRYKLEMGCVCGDVMDVELGTEGEEIEDH